MAIYLLICLSFAFSFRKQLVSWWNVKDDLFSPKSYRQYFKLAGFVLLGAIAARLNSNVGVFLVERFLDPAMLGLYSAICLFYLGVITAKGVVLTQIYPRLCHLYAHSGYTAFVWRWTLLLLLVSAAALPWFHMQAEWVIATVLGEQYATAEGISVYRVIIYAGAITLTGMLITNFLHVAGRATAFLWITGLVGLMNILVSWQLVQTYGVVGVTAVLLSSELLVVGLALMLFLRHGHRGSLE
jgi:O-antigen/teichoic acid export membrane protein